MAAVDELWPSALQATVTDQVAMSWMWMSGDELDELSLELTWIGENWRFDKVGQTSRCREYEVDDDVTRDDVVYTDPLRRDIPLRAMPVPVDR